MDTNRIRTVYVTGGSSGIGFAVAKEAVLRGASVLLAARNPKRLEDAAAELRAGAGGGRRIETIVLDVSDRRAVFEAMPAALRDFGDPDLLVNCAGDSFPGYFADFPDEDFEKTIDTHLKGTWYVTRSVLDGLIRRGGTIVNVSSIAGLTGVFGYAAYSAAKFGIVGFSEALRSELAPEGVKVVVLCPPDTDTPGLARENLRKPRETAELAGRIAALDPEFVARGLYAKLSGNSFLVVPGLSARAAAFAIRHFPGLVRRITDRSVRRVRGDSGSGRRTVGGGL